MSLFAILLITTYKYFTCIHWNPLKSIYTIKLSFSMFWWSVSKNSSAHSDTSTSQFDLQKVKRCTLILLTLYICNQIYRGAVLLFYYFN